MAIFSNALNVIKNNISWNIYITHRYLPAKIQDVAWIMFRSRSYVKGKSGAKNWRESNSLMPT